MPFQVISGKAAQRLKETGGTYNVKYITRMKVFKVPVHIVTQYEDIKRRFSHKDSAKSYALTGSHFTEMYKYYLMKTSEGVGAVRTLYTESKKGDVYLVNEGELPIIDALLDIMKAMSGVWDK